MQQSVVSEQDDVYVCIQNHKQQTAAAGCREFSRALVNSFGDTTDEEHFALTYESFLCYNDSEYLSHSQDIVVDEK